MNARDWAVRAARAIAPAALCWLLTAGAMGQGVMRQHVATVTQPVFGAALPGDNARFFIVELGGRIDVLNLPGNTLNTTPFLASIPGLYTGSEGGLLGLAFDPHFNDNGYFYLYFTTSGARIVERRTRSAGNPDLSDPASALRILQISGFVGAHNGGWIGFGPDGYLYISVGDGGMSAGAQTITNNLFGKILRIDVRGDDFPEDPNRNYRIPAGNPFVGIDGDDEIWAYGLRNPWRCAIDSVSGDLYIADVGFADWEEVSIAPAGVGGLNFGWPCREGFAGSACGDGAAFTPPVLVYGHFHEVPPLGVNGAAIVGGPVYRGDAIPWMRGWYLLTDYSHGWVYAVRFVAGALAQTYNLQCELANTANYRFGFGTDGAGEVYICDSTGVDKIIPDPNPQPDCNGNGRRDACDVFNRLSLDVNHDNIPDECRCPADWDSNGVVDLVDFSRFISDWYYHVVYWYWGTLGDFDNNGRVEPADVAMFIGRWLAAQTGGGC